jgi:hypothetical protein
MRHFLSICHHLSTLRCLAACRRHPFCHPSACRRHRPVRHSHAAWSSSFPCCLAACRCLLRRRSARHLVASRRPPPLSTQSNTSPTHRHLQPTVPRQLAAAAQTFPSNSSTQSTGVCPTLQPGACSKTQALDANSHTIGGR